MQTNSKLAIEIQYASPAIEKAMAQIASPALLKKWVRKTCTQSGLITLRFVNPTESKKLNLTFRHKDKPTNVLTFPYELSKTHLVADIIFCLPVIQKEARAQSKTIKAHLTHLVIPGCLHAQGFDHERAKDAQKMEAQEVTLLRDLAIDNPYLPLSD